VELARQLRQHRVSLALRGNFGLDARAEMCIGAIGVLYPNTNLN
jgi:hypothetical protein